MSIYSKRTFLCAIALYFALVQVVFGQTKHCLKKEEVDYCFTITLPPNDAPDNEKLVTFRLEAPANAGWLGLGVGEGMGGYLMVAWVNEDKIILSQREGSDGVQPMITDQQNDLKLLNTSNINDNNKLIVEFTRPLTVKGNTIERKQTFAYAYCSISPDDPRIDAYLNGHDYNGNVNLNLEGGSSKTVLSRYDKLIIAHALLMSAAWVVLIPAAIFIIRFAKRLFKLHIAIQALLSAPAIVAGSSLSYVAARGLDFDDPHKIIGFVLFIGFFIQLAIGEIHHKLFDKDRGYTPWWTKLHWWFGRSLVLLAIFQVPLGLRLYGSGAGYFYAYYVYIFILIIAYTFLSFRHWSKSGQDHGFARMRE